MEVIISLFQQLQLKVVMASTYCLIYFVTVKWEYPYTVITQEKNKRLSKKTGYAI